jgi:hypothetical protein
MPLTFIPLKSKAKMDSLNFTKLEKVCPSFSHMKLAPKVESLFSKLLLQKEYSDVTFKMKDKTYPGHKMLLASNSPVLKEMFETKVSFLNFF